MSAVVWIVSPSGPLRSTLRLATWSDRDAEVADPARIEILPQAVPAWLRQAADAAGIDVSLTSSRWTGSERLEFQLIGLARLSGRGMLLNDGPLVNPDKEGRFLLDLFRNPMDGAIAKVIDAVQLQAPIKI